MPLYRDHLSLFLVILIHEQSIHATWDFLWEVCSVVVLLVTTGNTVTKTRAFYGQSTSGSIARHALVLRLLVMMHYANTPTCYLLVNHPQIYLLFLSGNLYARSKSSNSSEVAKRITFGRIGNGCER